MKRNAILAGAVAAALGLMGGTALAAGTFSSALFAQEITASAAFPVTLTAGVPSPTGALGFGVSAGQSVYLRFDLSGDAATYGTASTPTLAIGSAAGGTVVSGGANAGYVIFQVTALTGGLTQSASYTLTLDTTSGVAISTTIAPVTISYAEYATAPDAANQTNPLSSANNMPLLSFAKALGVAGVAGSPLLIDVGSNNAKFKTSSGTIVTSPIGAVAINAIGGVYSLTGSIVILPDLVASTAGKTTLTVTGNFSAASTTTGGALDPAAVWLSSSATCAGSTRAGPVAASLTTTQAVFKLGQDLFGTYNNNGTPATYDYVCYTVSGSAPIAFGVTYTATYAPTANTTPTPGYILPSSVAMTLGTLTTNGITAQVLNIPSATNSDQPYIRIYNTSSLAGPIRGTLYAQDGTVLYNGVLISSLAAHAVQILTAQDLETLAGTTWTGRAYMQIFGQVPGMDVQSLIRDANGTLVNVSNKAPKQ